MTKAKDVNYLIERLEINPNEAKREANIYSLKLTPERAKEISILLWDEISKCGTVLKESALIDLLKKCEINEDEFKIIHLANNNPLCAYKYTNDEKCKLEGDTNYVLATDNDFEWVKDNGGYNILGEEDKGYFYYKGTDKKVVIPHTIKGNLITNYNKMFKETEV